MSAVLSTRRQLTTRHEPIAAMRQLGLKKGRIPTHIGAMRALTNKAI